MFFQLIQIIISYLLLQVVGVVNITSLSNRQYCVILDPVDAKGRPQLGQKKLVKVGRLDVSAYFVVKQLCAIFVLFVKNENI